ncbi:AAA family ATPase [Jiella sonneratiae]|uniref:AAA family ATPase n=1 Tax=Jiella sonneratiae TaxID=2816856 RepID=A0ABS3IZ65_9HYPH|nr:AAA family ATPase [Jiella sonneratiae]MBO0902697.1 AAA family ATPase [Jiella sonneratiae]
MTDNARSNSPSRRPDIPNRRTRTTDLSSFITRALMLRALRSAGMQHMLFGAPGAVMVIPSSDEDAEEFAKCARRMLRGSPDQSLDLKLQVYNATGGTSMERAAVEGITAYPQVVVVARKASMSLRALAAGADATLWLPSPDADLVGTALRMVRSRSPGRLDLEMVATLPITLMASSFRGRSVEQGVARARRLSAARAQGRAPVGDGPSLDDLHGLGDAAAWGRALAADLAEYRAGRLPWTYVDRGVLVAGPTGTGKTTFARALAKSCGVPIHVHSIARWQSAGHLGDMLRAMRKAFEEARSSAPCILFLDEIDSVGNRDERSDQNRNYTRQVVNGLLECLDGAEEREGVVVVGATNLPHVIDPAVLRPGRLDRRIDIPLPDERARQGILRHHLRNDLAATDLAPFAERLEGRSGADIERAVRDTRRRARSERRAMAEADLAASLPPVERLSDAAFRRACVHEAGHWIVGHALEPESGIAPALARVARHVAEGRGGFTNFDRIPGADRTRASHLAEIAVCLAGAAAELEVLGDRGNGAGGREGSDLQMATAIAVGLECSHGLGSSLLYRAPADDRAVRALLLRDPALAGAVQETLASCLERARTIVRERRTEVVEAARILGLRGRLQRKAEDSNQGYDQSPKSEASG